MPNLTSPKNASGQPLVPGYFADPSMLCHEGNFYLYATIDPWGGDTLACWESPDFQSWTYRYLNWPTTKQCISSTSTGSKVWAPSVVQRPDGGFSMFVSIGGETWVGSAPHPLGPWTNALDEQPLIPSTWDERYHMIDAECFVDRDGSAFLYWGSGLNWVNGRCFAVRLGADFASFDGEAMDVTPSNYFEAPFVHRRGDIYYLSYSRGQCTADTYQVHYATSLHPLGPFVESATSPILVTDHDRGILSPGHHAVFHHEGSDYIIYHRRLISSQELLREIFWEKLDYDSTGRINKVIPSVIDKSSP